MNRLWIVGIAAFAGLYVLFSSIFVVDERQQAIVTRFGEITRVYTEPGLYFKIPTDMVERVLLIEDRLLKFDLQDIRLQVSDGKFYNVDAFLTYRISDPIAFRRSVSGSLLLAEDRIDTRFESALRDVYGLRGFDAALSVQRAEMMRETSAKVRDELAGIGLDVVDVRILRTDLTAEVSAQTFERMKAERLAQAALLRARGQEAAQRLRAIAERQAVEITAEAQRDAEIIRGGGDAERNEIFAEAFNRDPEFFAFYRSMQSYREALSDTGTTLLLSPDSEFFQYFADDGSAFATPPIAPADAATQIDTGPDSATVDAGAATTTGQ